MNLFNSGRLFKHIPKLVPTIYSMAGSFLITAGWNWYHLPHRPRPKFILISLATWAAVYLGYRIAKAVYLYVVRRFERHPFWHSEFARSLDKLFFTFSTLFVVFFSRQELVSLIYASVVLMVIFFTLDRELARHPSPQAWRVVNKSVFSAAYFLFLLNSLLQYTAYRYYILDPDAKFYNIVIFRAWSMTMFWLIGFAMAGLFFWRTQGRKRYLGIAATAAFMSFVLLVWVANVRALSMSGLYFGPVALQHAAGGGGVVWTAATFILLFLYAAAVIILLYIVKRLVKAKHLTGKRYWHYYNFAIIAIGILSLFAFSSFKNAPEVIIAKSFYNYWLGKDEKIELAPSIFAKLSKFGLQYRMDQFNITSKDKVYKDDGKKLLPGKFDKNKPNIIIVFLESFSTRFVDIYNNNRFKNLTPGLDEMARDPNTTVIKKYFNASTPTVTGLISQLCSFLPPTGHGEIEKERRMQSVRLSCLPRILRSNGYNYSAYITAVNKRFANKGTIFESMGTDEFYGLEELSKYIVGEPLSWGYSDHQMFPAMMDIIKERAKEPYLLMLSTVDTHPPFNRAQDMVQWKNSRSNVLNAFHTTDDAFRLFWTQFRSSTLYNNTVVIAVADHAVFPAAITKDIFPEEVGKVSFYDENAFMIYAPDSILPKEVDIYSSGIDFAPTVLQLLGVNVPNSFEGYSIFDDRNKYPNLLGMHELGLYISEDRGSGARMTQYSVPSQLNCDGEFSSDADSPLTLCEFLQFYKWKRQMFEQGRLWEK